MLIPDYFVCENCNTVYFERHTFKHFCLSCQPKPCRNNCLYCQEGRLAFTCRVCDNVFHTEQKNKKFCSLCEAHVETCSGCFVCSQVR